MYTLYYPKYKTFIYIRKQWITTLGISEFRNRDVRLFCLDELRDQVLDTWIPIPLHTKEEAEYWCDGTRSICLSEQGILNLMYLTKTHLTKKQILVVPCIKNISLEKSHASKILRNSRHSK